MNVPLQRASIAAALLAQHPASAGCTAEEAASQFLSDLMHYCARSRLDFDDVRESAEQLYRDEVNTHCYFEE